MVGYFQPAQIAQTLSGMSPASKDLYFKFMLALADKGGTAATMLGTIADILPIALTVAGSILVVTLGWRLFRNFTRG